MEVIKKIIAQLGALWGKWTMPQRLILIGIVLAVVVGLGSLVSVSSSPNLYPVISTPIRDELARDRIVTRLNQEGVIPVVSASGIVQVRDEITAQRMRNILIREDLIPPGTSPWDVFDRDSWTTTDFERNVNLQRAITQMVADHLKALEDVDNVNVNIVFPADRLFASEQNPVTAAVSIVPSPGSDIATNRRKIEGIQKLLQFAVEGLRTENIVITDHRGMILNNFEDLAGIDRLNLIQRENRMRQEFEAQYAARILSALRSTFGEERVRDLNVNITMDMSQRSITEVQFIPTIIRERTPGLPYDDSEYLVSVTRSSAVSRTTWEGTGHIPEGPVGVEGNVSPVYRDNQNMFGRVEQETVRVNEEIGQRNIQEERSPEVNRITVSVNIDGTWRMRYDSNRNPVIGEDGSIERIYTPIPPEDLRQIQTWIQNAVGFNVARGDSVTVHNIPFDRSREFAEEDAAYFRQKQFETGIMVFFGGLAILLIAFILIRTISREIERRKRLEAEERARREEALRQQALLDAEEGMDVSLSVEERSRLDLQESVVNMTREHPEDAAQLIRTWLMEE